MGTFLLAELSSRTPFFSIVTPVYNRQDCIARCIQSTIVEPFANFEHIVVDDGSTDGTRAVVDKFASRDHRIRVFSSERNYGVNHARNVGISNARGVFILFLDSDDILLNGALDAILNSIHGNPGYLHYMFVQDDRLPYVNSNSLLEAGVNEVTFADWLSERVSGDFVHVIHVGVLKRFPFFEEFRLHEGLNFLRFYKFNKRQLIIREVVVGRERERADAVTREGTLYRRGAIEDQYRALGLQLKLFGSDYLELSRSKYDELMKRYFTLGLSLSKYGDLESNYDRLDPASKVICKLRMGVFLKFLLRSYSLQKAVLQRVRLHLPGSQ